MSRVARSARVGSRQRVETITDDKTIVAAESGEFYLVDVGDSLLITLPAPEEGTYFKFLLSDNSTAGAVLSFTGSASALFKGRAVQYLGSPHGLVNTALAEGARVVDSPEADEFKLVVGGSAGSGSYVEFYSDGTSYFVDAHVTGSTVTFA